MTYTHLAEWIEEFIEESNRIEGIYRKPTPAEIEEAWRFIKLDKIDLEEVKKFVAIYQPNAVLRDKKGLNVRVGNYYPPKGGSGVLNHLIDFLECLNDPEFGSDIYYNPFLAHKEYEQLHPFTDCNGRSGRIIWLWQTLKLKKNLAPMGFLQSFYYQSLSK